MLFDSSSGCHSTTSTAHKAAGEALCTTRECLPMPRLPTPGVPTCSVLGHRRAAGSPASWEDSFFQVQAPLCSQPFSTPGGLQADIPLCHLYEPKQYFRVRNVLLPEPKEAHWAQGFLLSGQGYKKEAICLCFGGGCPLPTTGAPERCAALFHCSVHFPL